MSGSTPYHGVDFEIPPIVGILLTAVLTIGIAVLLGTFVIV